MAADRPSKRHLHAVPALEYQIIEAPQVESGVRFDDNDLLQRALTVSISFDVKPEFDSAGELLNPGEFYVNAKKGELRNWDAAAYEYDEPSLTQQVEFIRDMKLMTQLTELMSGKIGVLETALDAPYNGRRARKTIVRVGNKKQGTVYALNGRILLDVVDGLEEKGFKISAEIYYAPYNFRPLGANYVQHGIGGMLRMPEASRLAKWLESSAAERELMNLEKPAKTYFRLKGQTQCESNIAKVTRHDVRFTGIAQIQREEISRGKYSGQYQINYYIDGLRVGFTQPEHRAKEDLLFKVVDRGVTSLPVRAAFGLDEGSQYRLIAEIDLDDYADLAKEAHFQLSEG